MQELDTRKIVNLAGESISRIYYKSLTGSTNDDAIMLAREGAESRTIVIAEEQTAGRGRRGAAWHCPPGEGLAFSWLCLASDLPEKNLMPSLLAGLATARAIAQLGISAKVKWPNDLLIDGKKVAGILTEMVDGHLVIGIGININVTDFPEDLQQIASSLSLAKGELFSREEVLARIAIELDQVLLGEENDLINELRDFCGLTGHAVSLTTSGKRLEGHVRGLGDSGELLFWTGRTTIAITQADEIRIEDEFDAG